VASRTLLFEIGCEEVPAKMLARALAELPARRTAALAAGFADFTARSAPSARRGGWR
jgi:glycyl-tRNA synthetase beta subunit